MDKVMTDLRWSKADTHCVWCGKKKAREAEWQHNHDEDTHDDDCWCYEFCWEDCAQDDDELKADIASLRATVEAQAEVIQRTADWLVSVGYPYDFRTDEGPPEAMRRPIAEAWWRKWDCPEDPSVDEAYALVAEEGQWGEVVAPREVVSDD